MNNNQINEHTSKRVSKSSNERVKDNAAIKRSRINSKLLSSDYQVMKSEKNREYYRLNRAKILKKRLQKRQICRKEAHQYYQQHKEKFREYYQVHKEEARQYYQTHLKKKLVSIIKRIKKKLVSILVSTINRIDKKLVSILVRIINCIEKKSVNVMLIPWICT